MKIKIANVYREILEDYKIMPVVEKKGKLFFGMQIEVTAWIGPGKRQRQLS